MKKVLIITYYWPPSGGAGVQRWLKLTKYFNDYNIKPYVITVDENHASYLQTDTSLNLDVDSNVTVYKTKSFEPIKLYEKIVGKKNIPTAGFSNVRLDFKQKTVNFLRSNFFIPDPRRGWNKYAYNKARSLIDSHGIKNIITTSPPHSTQLVGLKLKEKYDINWIADLRDPWTDIYYYSILYHSFISKRIDKHYEKKVLINSDVILTVSDSIKRLFSEKDKRIDENKIHVLPNGYDEDDFKNIIKEKNKNFTITYTGTMADIYEPETFLQAFSMIQNRLPKGMIKLQIIGGISQSIKDSIIEKKINFEHISHVPHSEITKFQKNADLLLLIIPNIEGQEGILTGKLFEYLASGNKVICLGPKKGDAANIIDKCNAGSTFNRNELNEIISFIEKQLFLKDVQNKTNLIEVKKYSRKNQASFIEKILND